jgi:hypothetical protein
MRRHENADMNKLAAMTVTNVAALSQGFNMGTIDNAAVRKPREHHSGFSYEEHVDVGLFLRKCMRDTVVKVLPQVW